MTSRAVVRYVRWRDSLPDLSGLEPDERWARFWALHERRCSCCRRSDMDVTDHDHVTGYVRGFLCRSCNAFAGSGGPHRRLSSFRNPLAAIYCQYPPAAVVGLWEMYESPWGGDPAPELEWSLWYAGPAGLDRPQQDPFSYAVKVL